MRGACVAPDANRAMPVEPVEPGKGATVPQISSDGRNLELKGGSGALMFSSKDCTTTDLCAVSRQVAALASKFGVE